MEQVKKEKFKWKRLRSLIIKLVIILGFVWTAFTYVFGWTKVSNDNMFPMIKNGDYVLYYRIGKPHLNDAVIYKNINNEEKIGRISAEEGQTVGFNKDGGFEVDGAVPSELLPYQTYKAKHTKVNYPLTIEKEESYILNDFRENTSDSREFGPIKNSRIKGFIIFVLRPDGNNI